MENEQNKFKEKVENEQPVETKGKKDLSLKNWKGLAFLNQAKQSNLSPDFKGQIMVEGTQYDISVWESTAKNNKKYLSFAISPVSKVD